MCRGDQRDRWSAMPPPGMSSGAFDRHPQLGIAFSEGGSGRARKIPEIDARRLFRLGAEG